MSLIKHVAPFFDESALGYIHRLAINNYLDGWKEVARILNVGASRSALMNSSDNFEKILGLPKKWVDLIKGNENQCQSWNRFHQSYHIKVCPECLKINPYRKNIWEHVFCTCCVEHKCELIDVCPACNSVLDKSLIGLTHCKCGCDLRNIDAVKAPVHLMIVSQMMNGYIKYEEHGLPLTENININKAANLLRIVCHQFDVSLPWRKSTEALPQSLILAKNFLSPMEDIFNDWPKNLEKHVCLRMENSSSDGYTPAKILGNWYTVIKSLTLGNTLELFLKIIINSASDFCGSTTSFDKASFLLEKHDGFLPISQAAEKHSINRLMLIKAANAGRIKFRKIGKARKAFTYEFFEEDVKKLKYEREQWCMAKDAYAYLGVSQYLFDQIVLADLVVVDRDWKSDVEKAGPVSKISLAELEININNKRVSLFDGKSIEIRKIASLKLGENSKLHDIFKAIYEGRIRVVACSGKFGEYKVSLEDIYSVLQVGEQGKGYSIEELGSLTGWKWEAIGHWMDCGILEFDNYKIKGRNCRFVTQKQLIDFQRKYIPTADLMRQVGRTTTYLKNRYPELSILGEKALPGGKFLGGLVSLSDWMKITLNLE